jgi:DNA-directed RNA polymerase specialized sigma24 family protein
MRQRFPVSDQGGCVPFDPVSSLDSEWRRLASRELPALLRVWSAREPTLAPFADPTQLIRFLREPAPSAQKDELLRALVRIAADDPLAARVVLQALMPGLKRIAGRVLLDLSERDELWELLLAHAWERIRQYPLARRPQRIAANILLDTLRRTMRELERERRRRHRSVTPEAVRSPNSDQRAEATRILLDAISASAISQLEARILFAIRVEHCSLADAAGEEGLPYNVLRVRLQRAERRLLLHLGYSGVPNRRSRGPFSSARVGGPTEASRIHPAPHVEEPTTHDIGWLSGADDA